MPQRLHLLERLSATLGDAVTVDDVACAALVELLHVEHVVRAGIAVSHAAGRELSFVSTDDAPPDPAAVRWSAVDGLADVPVAQTVRTSAPVYLSSIEELEREFPEIADRQRRLGTQSMVSVPMTVEGACVGGLLLSYEVPQDFPHEQQAFLGAFAAQVSQALRRALAYHTQWSTSEQLQRSLMPHSLPDLPGLALGAHYRPGGVNVDVGGDWYDVMTLPDGSVVVMLGDVMGKGVPAAIVMSEVRSATRAYALLDPDPVVVLERLDLVVSTLPFADQIVTILYGLVDPERRRVHLAVAGHPPPLLVSPEGRPTVLDAVVGPALGLGAGPWASSPVELEDNATLLFYSDGLVESRSQDLFLGIDLLRDHVEQLPARRRNPRELCARLGDEMRTADADDDVTLLALTASEPHPSASTDLPADASAAGLARRFVTTVLDEWSIDEDVADTAQLCVSELVTNAVIHSGTTSTLTVRSDGEYLLVMVQDRGGRGGAVREAADLEPEAISGRGLLLVDALASAWSSEQSADGTTVWFELPVGQELVGSGSMAQGGLVL